MFLLRSTICILVTYVALGEAVSKSDVLSYFNKISGSKTIAGQHNREPNSDPSKWTRTARDITGLYPGLWGGDFLFLPDDVQHRQTMIDEAIKEWKAGSVVALTWHVCPPNKGETCNWDSNGVLSQLSDGDWNSLIQDGSDLNKKWKQRLDTIVPYLQQLKDNGVVAVWRPLHEINDGWSWWGGRPGANGSRKLYQITHDYLAPKFDNLIWNWCVKDINVDSIGDYWPGGDYVDVASLDIWVNKQPNNQHYQKMLSVAQGKPIALAEVGSVPSPSTLEQQNKWIWFMVWAEYLKDQSYNTDQKVKDTYYLARTLRQGDIDFGSGGGGSDDLALNRPVKASSQQDSSTGPGNIVDGGSSKWASDENLDQWIYVDLGASKSIGKVVVEWDADYAKGYQIQTSNDESTWTTVYENYNGDGGSDQISLSASGRWVKIYMFQKGGGSRYSVKELQVFS